MEELKKQLCSKADEKRAEASKRFFKTGKGEYGEGDKFLGITVPESREVARKFINLDLKEIEKHLRSEWHEERLIALLILAENYKKNKDKRIVDFYLNNLEAVNNWDLVDTSAPYILGEFLLEKNKEILYRLAKSDNLWERRIAIVATFNFIKNNKFDDALKISKLLLKDTHDLINKAVGWMLREIGKRNEKLLENFLEKNYDSISRTTLRYAIERFAKEKRIFYLNRQF